MRLSLDYIKLRHNYWIKEIGDRGIWKPELFKEINFIIRKNHKRYNALFQRKWNRKTGEIIDSIVIYNKTEDFEPKYLDSLIVHEMIHQYLVQNSLNERRRPHGKVFKDMMNIINSSFPGQLEIKIKSENPSIPESGKGDKIHTLLMVKNSLYCYCCLVNPKRKEYFERQVKLSKKKGRIKDYIWVKSSDVHFNHFTKSTKVLSGEKIKITDILDYCKKYKITTLNS